jgi:hypothetical protein
MGAKRWEGRRAHQLGLHRASPDARRAARDRGHPASDRAASRALAGRLLHRLARHRGSASGRTFSSAPSGLAPPLCRRRARTLERRRSVRGSHPDINDARLATATHHACATKQDAITPCRATRTTRQRSPTGACLSSRTLSMSGWLRPRAYSAPELIQNVRL